MHIFFSVGEPSGDQHTAHLIREIRSREPDVIISGFGGPLMKQAGCRLLYRLTDLAVMGIFHVIPLLGQFIRLVGEAGRYFQETRPDAVVLVDFPGFNWWIARKAKAAGIPVFYYLPPQLWAWAPWRIRRMRRLVDHVLCSLPFERTWYANRGMSVDDVGHPFFDEVAEHRLDQEFCGEWSSPTAGTVGILPGSRTMEISRNWPLMVQVMQDLSARCPHVRFLIACYKQAHQTRCREFVEQAGISLPIHYFVGRTSEIIETSDCCLMVSGSVSLEMLARRKPAVVVYRIARWLLPLKTIFVRLKSITLTNLIAGRNVLPEFIVHFFPRRDVRAMTDTLAEWLTQPLALDRAVGDLTAIHDDVVRTGATTRAAEQILKQLADRYPHRQQSDSDDNRSSPTEAA